MHLLLGVFTFAAAFILATTAQQTSLLYVLRILASPAHPLHEALIHADSTGVTYSLFATADADADADPTPPSPWTFQTDTDLSLNTAKELSNATTQLLLLGRRFRIWDPEPAVLQMVAEPKGVAKTGWPGTPWPSAYIEAKWAFPVEWVQQDPYGTGRWLLMHGYDHGDWRAQPDGSGSGATASGRWEVVWWNGTDSPDLRPGNIQIQIEVLPLADSGDDTFGG